MMVEAGVAHSTGHDDVDETLVQLGTGIQEALGENLIGFYLTGSLTYGDFDRGSSDIDYLVAMERELFLSERESLRQVHAEVGERFPNWKERIEGTYVTRQMLLSRERPEQGRPYMNQGAFWEPDPPYGNEWVLNLFVLQEHGAALIGPEFTTLAVPVSVAAVRTASNADLFEERLPTVDDPTMYDDPHQQAYSILTICRILHRNASDEVVSKRGAARWAQARYGEPWSSLIERAEQWEHGQSLATADEVKAFLRFAADEVGDSGPTRASVRCPT